MEDRRIVWANRIVISAGLITVVLFLASPAFAP